jgi:tRNA threonylcarbamoyladenosine biosynthesis protein TsaB
VPVVGISSLEALASQVVYAPFPITPVIESRKGEFFAASFLWTGEYELVRQREDMAVRVDDFPHVFTAETVLVGTDFHTQGTLLRTALGLKARLAPSPLWGIKASFLAHLGLGRLLKGESDDPHALVPRYLRPPDIRPNPYAPAGLPRNLRNAFPAPGRR